MTDGGDLTAWDLSNQEEVGCFGLISPTQDLWPHRSKGKRHAVGTWRARKRHHLLHRNRQVHRLCGCMPFACVSQSHISQMMRAAANAAPRLTGLLLRPKAVPCHRHKTGVLTKGTGKRNAGANTPPCLPRHSPRKGTEEQSFIINPQQPTDDTVTKCNHL